MGNEDRRIPTGKGNFSKIGSGLYDAADIDAMKNCFASKGYTFIPGEGDVAENAFIGPDGKQYTNDEIHTMIFHSKL